MGMECGGLEMVVERKGVATGPICYPLVPMQTCLVELMNSKMRLQRCDFKDATSRKRPQGNDLKEMTSRKRLQGNDFKEQLQGNDFKEQLQGNDFKTSRITGKTKIVI